MMLYITSVCKGVTASHRRYILGMVPVLIDAFLL